MSYQLTFFLIPRVVISDLPLLYDLLDKLATEKYLYCTFNITEGKALKVHISNWTVSNFHIKKIHLLKKFRVLKMNLHQYPKLIQKPKLQSLNFPHNPLKEKLRLLKFPQNLLKTTQNIPIIKTRIKLGL